MNFYLVFILAILITDALLGLVVRRLNAEAASAGLPEEFRDVYDAERYARSQEYLRANARFGTLVDLLWTPAIAAFILAGGFGHLDRLARAPGWGPIPTGLVFAGVLALAASLLSIPFSAWRTFVLEERFGFNRTKLKTFVLDIFKGWLLGGLIGGAVLSVVIWLFATAGPWAWLLVWAAVSAFQVFVAFIAPVLLMPLFYKFEPLEQGELRDSIEAFARAWDFQVQGIYTVDGSRRSDKANAFFTGFGRSRRIALFDTLIEKHPPDEIVAVLAHEVGHYKHRHVLMGLGVSILTLGLLCFLFSLFLENRGLFDAFGVENFSVHAGLVFFAFLFEPISMALGIAGNALSRRNERQADAFAARTTENPDSLASALKRLSADTLANLTPHPLAVFLHYGHPPVLERVRRLLSYRALRHNS